MTNTCTPGGAPPTVDDPCALLPALRAAMYALMAGQARFEVRNGDQWLSFQKGDAAALQHEVRRLELICGRDANQGRAIRVGPYTPTNAPFRRRPTRLI